MADLRQSNSGTRGTMNTRPRNPLKMSMTPKMSIQKTSTAPVRLHK